MHQNHKIISVLVFLGWALLFFLVLSSPDCFIAAEITYYMNLYSADSYFSYNFIKNYQGTAGILNTWFHGLIYPLTQGNIVAMRVTNVLWLLLTAFFLNKMIRKEDLTTYRYAGFMLIFFPSVYILAARNMGDFPAFFMAVFFYYLIGEIKSGKKEIFWYMLAGCVGSLAIVGKQTLIFLLVIPAYMFLKHPDKRKKLLVLLFFMLLLPLVLYSVWSGILPKSSTFKIDIFSLAYTDFLYVLLYVFFQGLIMNSDFIRLYLKESFLWQSVVTLFLILLFDVPFDFPFFNTNLLVIRNSEWFFIIDYAWKFMAMYLCISGFRFIWLCFSKNLRGGFDKDLVIFMALFFLIFLKLPVYTGRYLAMVSPFIFLLSLRARKGVFYVAGLFLGLSYNVFNIITLYYPEVYMIVSNPIRNMWSMLFK